MTNWFTLILKEMTEGTGTAVLPRWLGKTATGPYNGAIIIYRTEGKEFCVGWGSKDWHFHVMNDGKLSCNFDYKRKYTDKELECMMRQVWMQLI